MGLVICAYSFESKHHCNKCKQPSKLIININNIQYNKIDNVKSIHHVQEYDIYFCCYNRKDDAIKMMKQWNKNYKK